VKWSRKKVSHGDDTLAALFSQYGHVTAVELTGGKGNAALVTFDSPAAAAAAAAANSTGDTLRATRVSGGFTIPSHTDSSASSGWAAQASGCVTDTDFESVVMGRMRQAAERDRLIREMQQESGTGTTTAGATATGSAAAAAAATGAAGGSSAPAAAAVAEEDVLARMLRQSAAQQQQQQKQSDSPQQPTALQEDDILARMMAMSGAAAASSTAAC
jgi:hypothetical protein